MTGHCLIRRVTAVVVRLVFSLALLSLSIAGLHVGSAEGSTGAPGDEQASSSSSFLGINPEYNSVVDINRTQRRWDQTFRARKQEGAVLFDSNWRLGTQENPAQNDYRQRLGTVRTRVEYATESIGGVSTGVNTRFWRNFSNSSFRRTVDNGQDGDLFVTSGLLGNAMERGLGLGEASTSWTVTALAGIVSDLKTSQTKSEAAGLTRSDSTDASGTMYGLESQLNYGGQGALTVTANARVVRESQESSTDRFSAAADTTERLDDTNENRTRRFRVASTWSPNSRTRFNLGAHHNREISQYYSTVVQAQDTKEGVDHRIGLDGKLTPFWGIELTMKAETSLTDITYDIATQGRGRRRNFAEGKTKFTLGRAFGILRGTELTTEYRWEETRNSIQASADFDNVQQRIRQGIRRPLTRKLVFLGTMEGSISQSFYDNRSNDRDELRWLFDGALGYRPTRNLDTRLTAQWQQRETINIPAANARNSNTQNSYRIGAEITARPNPSLQISQRYTITADYSFYRFNEDNNGLVRTTEVRTQLRSTIGSRAKLELDHSFRFRDSGRYTSDVPGEPRMYGLSSEENFQNLAVTTSYEFATGFDVRATQRMETRTTTQVATGESRRTERLEFTGGMELIHRFSPDFSVNARVDRTQSMSEDDYWRVVASANRRF